MGVGGGGGGGEWGTQYRSVNVQFIRIVDL